GGSWNYYVGRRGSNNVPSSITRAILVRVPLGDAAISGQSMHFHLSIIDAELIGLIYTVNGGGAGQMNRWQGPVRLEIRLDDDLLLHRLHLGPVAPDEQPQQGEGQDVTNPAHQKRTVSETLGMGTGICVTSCRSAVPSS